MLTKTIREIKRIFWTSEFTLERQSIKGHPGVSCVKGQCKKLEPPRDGVGASNVISESWGIKCHWGEGGSNANLVGPTMGDGVTKVILVCQTPSQKNVMASKINKLQGLW